MTVQDVLDIYEAEDNYVANSMINKSYDSNGCIFQWLFKNTKGAFRKEIFIATTGAEEVIEEREVIEYVEVSQVS